MQIQAILFLSLHQFEKRQNRLAIDVFWRIFHVVLQIFLKTKNFSGKFGNEQGGLDHNSSHFSNNLEPTNQNVLGMNDFASIPLVAKSAGFSFEGTYCPWFEEERFSILVNIFVTNTGKGLLVLQSL